MDAEAERDEAREAVVEARAVGHHLAAILIGLGYRWKIDKLLQKHPWLKE